MTDAAESPFAMKSGVIPRGDHCVLVSSYGKMKRPLALDQAQQSQSPVKGLFSRDYVGPIPSIRTGFNTDMRRFLSTVGLHKAFQTEATTTSIILTGRCEDDQDYGDWIVYTGTDLTGDVNNDEQATHDQKLEGYNLMLAKCCAAPINAKRGSHAHGYWLQGTPIRVIRGSGSVRLSGSSQRYMPYSGFRYDGIYKVVQYKPRRGIQGNIVWQFALRRCDRSPAPWTMKDKYNGGSLL